MKPISILHICAAILCLTLAVSAGILTSRLLPVVENLDQTTSRANEVSELARDYLAEQKAILSSDKNRKALEAGYQTPAVLNGTIRLVNTQTIPRINRAFDRLDMFVGQSEQLSRNLSVLIANLDRRVNGELLPEITSTAKALNTSVDTTTRAINEVLATGKLSLEDVHTIMSSPEWLTVLKNIEKTSANAALMSENGVTISAHAATVTGNIAEASAQMPSIARSVEKIANTSSKYSKALLLAQILSTIARALIP